MSATIHTNRSGEQKKAMAKPLTVGIASTALFDLSISNKLYQQKGLEAYRQYQISQEEVPLEPGDGFYLVEKLLNKNLTIHINLTKNLPISSGLGSFSERIAITASAMF